MLSALFVLGIQSQTQLGPIPPAGSNHRFQSGVAKVTQYLFEGKFNDAKVALQALPQKAITYRLNTKELDPIQSKMAQSALANAILATNNFLPELTFKPVAKDENILIDFTDSLPVDENTKLPKGAVNFTSIDPNEPAVENVIALKRLETKVSVEEGHMAQEMFFAIGQYLGLEQTPGNMGISNRTDSLSMGRVVMTPTEKGLILENFKIVDELKKAVESKTKLQPAKVQAQLSQKVWEIGETVQGDIPQVQIGVTNSGNAPLKFWMEPDCSCFLIRTAGVAEPGKTANINIMMDTYAFSGPQLKKIYIYTNDPDHPVFVLPVTTTIKPAYQFLRDGAESPVEYIQDQGTVITRYLAITPGQDIKLHDVKVNGINATVSFEPWTGTMPSPKFNEPALARTGYKISILVAPGGIKGRVDATIVATTNNEDFKVIMDPLSVQRGIAINPTVLYFGEVKTQLDSRAWAILSQPGRPFKIVKIVSNHANFKATAEPMPGGDYKLVVDYDGKGVPGQFTSSIEIHTDSKDTPIVEIPIQGFLR